MKKLSNTNRATGAPVKKSNTELLKISTLFFEKSALELFGSPGKHQPGFHSAEGLARLSIPMLLAGGIGGITGGRQGLIRGGAGGGGWALGTELARKLMGGPIGMVGMSPVAQILSQLAGGATGAYGGYQLGKYLTPDEEEKEEELEPKVATIKRSNVELLAATEVFQKLSCDEAQPSKEKMDPKADKAFQEFGRIMAKGVKKDAPTKKSNLEVMDISSLMQCLCGDQGGGLPDHYREGDGEHSCSVCRHMLEDRTCEVHHADVDGDMVCNNFEPHGDPAQ